VEQHSTSPALGTQIMDCTGISCTGGSALSSLWWISKSCSLYKGTSMACKEYCFQFLGSSSSSLIIIENEGYRQVVGKGWGGGGTKGATDK
jgi:hypothetical protein